MYYTNMRIKDIVRMKTSIFFIYIEEKNTKQNLTELNYDDALSLTWLLKAKSLIFKSSLNPSCY